MCGNYVNPKGRQKIDYLFYPFYVQLPPLFPLGLIVDPCMSGTYSDLAKLII